MSYVVAVDGLSVLDDMANVTRGVAKLAQRAVNKTAERSRTSSARRMREQVAFPARYLSGSDGRLELRKASGSGLEASITGRARATSLARFVTSGSVRRAGQARSSTVRVQVAPGKTIELKRAFLMKLRAGNQPIETQHNLGLAIRLKPGERIRNKHQMIQIAKGLYLLYGPSVDQVFRTVAEDEAPEAATFLENEFLRLMEVGNLDV